MMNVLDILKAYVKSDGHKYEAPNLTMENIEECIAALEKAHATKPNDETYFTEYAWQKRCPSCGEWVKYEDGGTRYKMNYCTNCGQKIKWTGTSEQSETKTKSETNTPSEGSAEERLLNAGYDDVVIFENYSYDSALIGVSEDGRAVYSFDKMVEWLMAKGFSRDEAIEWIEYNTIRAIPYAGNSAPVIMFEV